VPKKYLRKMRISIALLLFIYSCNPVKQVLSDRAKFDEVAKEVIRAGYCANDTVIVSKSDTTVSAGARGAI
jgi:hypothetical protein